MKKNKRTKKTLSSIIAIIVLVVVFLLADTLNDEQPEYALPTPQLEVLQIPQFSGQAYTIINDNKPFFAEEELTTQGYEFYSPLDYLGRCGGVIACLGRELMPTEKRESISHVYPSGWVQATYDFVDGQALYNRCHLIGFQLSGENDNERNLITGTRYMNTVGMLPFENMVADYIKETGNHVLYRVSPIFEGAEPVARGVQMEALSVEDNGEGISFNVFCYNVQPGVIIDYATGESRLDESAFSEQKEENYILNMSSKTIHTPTCDGAQTMSEKNRKEYTGSAQTLISQGYKLCPNCMQDN